MATRRESTTESGGRQTDGETDTWQRSDARLGYVGGRDVGTERLTDTSSVAGDQVTVAAVVPVRRSASAPHRQHTNIHAAEQSNQINQSLRDSDVLKIVRYLHQSVC